MPRSRVAQRQPLTIVEQMAAAWHRVVLRLFAGLAALLASALALGLWLASAPQPAYRADGADVQALERGGGVERGRLVFHAADCASCHASPGQSDPLVLGGGLALASPYGTLRAPNISPHPVDGIGRWRTRDLANAILSGVSPDGRHYYPVLPYTSYVRMQPGDVADLMAYLRTLKPVAGRSPSHDLTFPFNVRRAIGIWKLLYFDRAALVVDPARSAAWNRGRYLVDAVAHCAECHSSRNIAGAIKEKTRFAGGRDPEGTGFIPNITPVGIGAWTKADIAAALTDGRTPDLRKLGSSMADVVENTARLPQADRDAIAEYVKTLRSRPTAEP